MDKSIDMLRLSVPVPYHYFIEFANIYLSSSPFVFYWESFQFSSFRFNFRISSDNDCPFIFDNDNNDKDNSFYLGYLHNSEKKIDNGLKKYNLTLEFNPNKIDFNFGLLKVILNEFFFSSCDVVLKSFDFAFDLFDVPVLNLIYDRCKKRKELDFRCNGSITRYVGSRGSNGSVKIYDKGREQKVDYIWSRCEFTFRCDVFISSILSFNNSLININFDTMPCIYVLGKDFELSNLSIQDICCFYSLLRGDVFLSDFSRKLKDKYKKLLSTYCDYKIDSSFSSDIVMCLCDYFYNVYSTLFGFKCQSFSFNSNEKKDSLDTFEQITLPTIHKICILRIVASIFPIKINILILNSIAQNFFNLFFNTL